MSAGILYGGNTTTCTQRVMVVAYENNVELDFKVVDLSSQEHKKEPFISKQPFGQVPAFEAVSGTKFFESRAIARYIDAKAGGKLGHINNLEKYALVETWISVETSNFDKYAGVLVLELYFKGLFGYKTDDEEVSKYKAKLTPILDVYDKELATRKYLTGDQYTLADLFHLPYANHLFRVLPELLATRPNLKTWYETLSSLPSWQKTLAFAGQK